MSEMDVEDSEKATTASSSPKTICYGSESSAEMKFDGCKCNNNIGDCDFGVTDKKIKSICACLKENRQNDGNISLENARKLRKRRDSKGKFTSKRNKKQELCQEMKEDDGDCGTFEEQNLSTVGGDCDEMKQERSRCQQHELNSSIEINRRDVTESCDLTSNSMIKFKSESGDEKTNENKKDCPRTRISSCSIFQSTCSEGSYSRRRHHKHHKHKKRNNRSPHPEESTQISPKVNPIFLWVRQEDTKIVEVLCEDYDHRNRLRLTRTHLGWRAIPKTKTFAEAIIPKPKEVKNFKELAKPKHSSKRLKKKKKGKKKKEQKVESDNPNQIKECSVALCRDDLANYNCKALILQSEEKEVNEENVEMLSKSESYNEEVKDGQSINQSRPSSPDSIIDSNDLLSNFRKLTKSNSCEFTSVRKISKKFPRSVSLDLNLARENIEFKVQKLGNEVKELNSSKERISDVKNECEVEKEKEKSEPFTDEKESVSETEFEKAVNQRKHSEPVLVDMTKHDLDFNDTDCDEWGQLLKDIPDLEFVEEEELEEIDEEEEWLKPTDLTVQKSTIENEIAGIKLPPNITPMVTVTSSSKPTEPLTAPLPEVTITPISKPKPAHQQKPQNNFLENLLSSTRSVKPETSDVNVTQKKLGKSLKFSQYEKKALKHFQEPDGCFEMKSKKLKVEDITLKTLLSRNQPGKNLKTLDIESCMQKLKAIERDENTRLKESLIDTNTDPITQLKEVLSNPLLSVPDPLLVPRARLPALVASPASEIPRLLSMHLEKPVEETPRPLVTDSDILEVSLSNLQSLLSCSPEKVNSANNQDLAKYQKSLETFLEWQRYQSELIEAQIKTSKSVLPGFPSDLTDVAAATAFSQMLWLPYLNQFDFNCNSNRDFMSVSNSMLMNDYQANCSKLSAPPQINTNQVSQPSPFLTPTSPMEFESHLKTLAMWQEALMMQQNSQYARACTKASNQDLRKSGKFPNISHPTSNKKMNCEVGFQGRRGTTISPISSRMDSNHNSQTHYDIFQDPYQNDYYKRQNRQHSFQQKLEFKNQLEIQQKCKAEIQNSLRKPHQNYSNQQTEFLKHCKGNEKTQMKKSGSVTGSISVKPLVNLIDKSILPRENKKIWENSEEESINNSDFTSQVASKLLQFNTEIQKTSRKEEKTLQDEGSDSTNSKLGDTKSYSKETPKLKVKNLVDPNMSPPKLLKQIAPEHLAIGVNDKGPIPDDGQANLWHPLFGSNQIKLQSYNSPWRWTTVTVNGE